MELKEVIRLNPTKENHFAVLDKSIPACSGIYFLYDANLLLLYIGKAKSIRQRILQHTSEKANGRYEKGDNKTYGYTTCLPKGSVKYYSYIEIEDERERTLKELMLIEILKPFFNYVNIDEKLEEYNGG